MKDYRTSFINREQVDEYKMRYSTLTQSSFLWQLEKSILDEEISKIEGSDKKSYLDFACGTGRVLGHLEGRFRQSTGIDISDQMIRVTREETSKSNLICKDVTAEDGVEAKYDCITAFRFFLHADEQLRMNVIQKLKERMKDKDSILIINNHGNRYSFLIIFYFLNLIKKNFGAKNKGGFLKTSDLIKTLDRVGLRVEKRVGFGFFPGFLIRSAFFSGTALRIEKKIMSRGSRLGFLGINQILICKFK